MGNDCCQTSGATPPIPHSPPPRTFSGSSQTPAGVVKKKWPPIVTPDYTPDLTQMSAAAAVISGLGGSNPVKFMTRYKDQRIALPLVGGAVAMDDGLLKRFGDEALGVISSSAYTVDPDASSNRRFVADTPRWPFHCDDFGNVAGKSLSAAARNRTASSSTTRSRPTQRSASYGPVTRSGFRPSAQAALLSMRCVLGGIEKFPYPEEAA